MLKNVLGCRHSERSEESLFAGDGLTRFLVVCGSSEWPKEPVFSILLVWEAQLMQKSEGAEPVYLLRATGELRGFFETRYGDDLQRFGHGRIDVQEIDKVADGKAGRFCRSSEQRGIRVCLENKLVW